MAEIAEQDLTLDEIRQLVESGEAEVPNIETMTREELLETIKSLYAHHDEHHELDRQCEKLTSNLALKLARAAEYMDHFVFHAMQGKPAPLGEDNLVELQAMKDPDAEVNLPRLRALVVDAASSAVHPFRTDAELTTALIRAIFIKPEYAIGKEAEIEGYHQALTAGLQVAFDDATLKIGTVSED